MIVVEIVIELFVVVEEEEEEIGVEPLYLAEAMKLLLDQVYREWKTDRLLLPFSFSSSLVLLMLVLLHHHPPDQPLNNPLLSSHSRSFPSFYPSYSIHTQEFP